MRRRLEQGWLASVTSGELLFSLGVVLSYTLVNSGGQGDKIIEFSSWADSSSFTAGERPWEKASYRAIEFYPLSMVAVQSSMANSEMERVP